MMEYTENWLLKQRVPDSAKPHPFSGTWPTRVYVHLLGGNNHGKKSPPDFIYNGKPSILFHMAQRHFTTLYGARPGGVVIEYDRKHLISSHLSGRGADWARADLCKPLRNFYTPGIWGLEPLSWIIYGAFRVEIHPGYYIYSPTKEALYRATSLEVLARFEKDVKVAKNVVANANLHYKDAFLI